ncbi:SDR family oxidoreductase [Vibrio sp.]|uniref:SDR family oxidoreductase n=1 Tax=Vibrio viridaestus TaxID=2487322 RepID=A0A3N9TES6_9VIBR|nr:SDR family oxidoreductase [Vibrio viridaestus]MDC0611395.1 SDR family oxidoreductase [Vibrio sp.]RQW62731.1 SDR family oxidoreductase [Vibrio viridaestus]
MSQIAVITGANRGIGLELTKHYVEMGWKVYAVCRQASPALEELDVMVINNIDVSDAESVAQLSKALAPYEIDLLINNAGILRDEQLGCLDYQSIEDQFVVNTLGPLRVTEALLGNMSKGSKIALVTSRMGSIADNSSGGRYGYRMSKAALNAAGKSLSIDLKPRGIAVAILHPGYVQTEMVGGRGNITAQEAAFSLIERINALSISTTGTFWHSNGEELPW